MTSGENSQMPSVGFTYIGPYLWPLGNAEVSQHKTNKGHPPSFLSPKLTSDCVDTLNNANHN